MPNSHASKSNKKRRLYGLGKVQSVDDQTNWAAAQGFLYKHAAMKLAACILCIFLVLLLTIESEGWRRRRRRKARPKTKVNVGLKNGVDVNKGRHNVNVNYKSTNYEYNGRNRNVNANYNYAKKNLGVGVQGGKWTVNGNHNFRNKHTSVNANRGNHQLNAGYNHRNRAVGIGYKWKFGKRRRRELGTSQRESQTADMRLRELAEDLEILKSMVPGIDQALLPPHDGPVREEILAQDMRCLVRQFGQLLPQLKSFIKKMIGRHGSAHGLKVELVHENIPGCQALGDSVGLSGSPVLEDDELLEIKTFVSELILTELELQANLGE